MTLKKPSSKTLQKIGWAVLVLVLVAILSVMAYMIATTQRELPISSQVTGTSPVVPTSASEALLANGSSLDPEVQAALDTGSIATLDTVRDGDEFGVATRTFSDNKFTMDIIISTTPPNQKTSYVAWLDGEELIQLGALEKDTTEDNTYILEFNSPEDFSNIDKVIISQEPEISSSIDTPTLIILEGIF